jgi:hypothetical protein
MIQTPNPSDLIAIRERIREQSRTENVRLTRHAHQEIAEEGIAIDEVLQALCSCEVLENYPTHPRGPCCLVGGMTGAGRQLHVVCTTAQPSLIIITVYEPKPPKWATPTQRGGKI